MKNFYLTFLLIAFSLRVSSQVPNRNIKSVADSNKMPLKVKVNETNAINLKKVDSLVLTRDSLQTVKIPSDTILNLRLEEKTSNDWFNLFSTIAGTIFGFLIAKGTEWVEKREKKVRTRNRWISEIENLRSPLMRQIEENTTVIESYREENYVAPEPKIVSGIECNSFQQLDKGELFQYIEWIKKNDYQESVKISNDTNEWIDRIKDAHNHIVESINQYKSHSSTSFEIFNENLQSFLPAIRDLVFDLRSQNEIEARGNIVKLLEDVIEPHLLDGNFDVFVLRDRLFKPLLEILFPFKDLPNVKNTIDIITKCLNNIHKIKAELVYLGENWNTINIMLEKRLAELPDITSQLAEHPNNK